MHACFFISIHEFKVSYDGLGSLSSKYVFITLGNKECSESSNLIEQANFCHYNTKFRSQCPPSPTILNFGENLTSGNGKDYCVCAYRAAKYTCAIGWC